MAGRDQAIGTAAAPGRLGRRAGHVLYLAVVVVYVYLLTPLVIVVLASVNAGEFLTFPPEGFSLRWYVSFFESKSFMDALYFSLRLAFLATIVSTALGVAVALYVVRFAGRWRERLRLFILLPLLLPEILTAIALLFFYYNAEAFFRAIGLDVGSGVFRNSALGLLIGHVLITLPFVFLGISASLYNFDRSLEEAARSLGASRFTTFRRVTLPIIKPGIIAGALLAFIISLRSVQHLAAPQGDRDRDSPHPALRLRALGVRSDGGGGGDGEHRHHRGRDPHHREAGRAPLAPVLTNRAPRSGRRSHLRAAGPPRRRVSRRRG